MTVDGINIPLQTVNGDTLQLDVRRPTQEELTSLPCVIICRVCFSTIRRKRTIFDRAFRHLNNRTINATIASTTQLASTPFEAESRIIPRQHRAQRAPALAVTRLPGRTDTDPFFCSVKSVRGHSIAQLFVYVPSSWVSLFSIAKERFSASALEDFVRSRGAPNNLVLDCSATQKGDAWKSITRRFAIKHTFTAPHNQCLFQPTG